MSVSYYAYTLIGVEVPYSRLFKSRETKLPHEHPVPPKAHYCPTCGKQTKLTFSDPIYDDDHQLGSFSVVIIEYPSKTGFVGYAQVCSDYGKKIPFDVIPDIDELQTKLEKELTPLGLWNRSKFGIYTILQVS